MSITYHLYMKYEDTWEFKEKYFSLEQAEANVGSYGFGEYKIEKVYYT